MARVLISKENLDPHIHIILESKTSAKSSGL